MPIKALLYKMENVGKTFKSYLMIFPYFTNFLPSDPRKNLSGPFQSMLRSIVWSFSSPFSPVKRSSCTTVNAFTRSKSTFFLFLFFFFWSFLVCFVFSFNFFFSLLISHPSRLSLNFQYGFSISHNMLLLMQANDQFELRINNQPFSYLYTQGSFSYLIIKTLSNNIT